MPEPTPLVVLRGITRNYREGMQTRTVLDGVDLEVAPGERLALVGPSGSGKSTLLNLISGIDLPSQGQVLFDGVDLTALRERERTLLRREHIGFVFQFFNLIPTLTVAENVLLPLSLLGRTDAAHRSRALDRLDRVGLADRAGSFPDVLSGGEQQRLAIVRALAHTPDLLLADEPTGNLDEDNAAQVLALLDEAVREAGTTLVMVTHSTTAAAICQRWLRVHEHRLTAVPRGPAATEPTAQGSPPSAVTGS